MMETLHSNNKFLSLTASSRPCERPTRNSFGALSGNLGGANGFQAFVGEWRHCAITSIAPPVSRAYHLRNGWPFRSRSVARSTCGNERRGDGVEWAGES